MKEEEIIKMQTFNSKRYENIKYRRCGRSGLKLPSVSLGFWQSLGEPGNEETCRKCMYYAFDHGITHFDIANNYGPPPGNSELVVGKILKDMPRDELIISTKAGYYMWQGPYGDFGSKKYLVASLDQSLKRLGLDYVDIFYHHRPDPETPIEETLATMDLIVKQGKALYLGLSNYRGEQFKKAVDVIKQRDWSPIVIHQPSYSMLNRWIEADLLPHTAEAGTGVITFSPLAQGMLTDRYIDGLPPDSRMGKRGEDGKNWYEKQTSSGVLDKVKALREIAKSRGQTTAQLAITWILRDDRITTVLVGASKVEQVAENVQAANAPKLSEEELEKIEKILRG